MTEQIKLPGDQGGSCGPQKIKIYGAVPHDGSDGMLLSWEEETPIFGTYVEGVMSMALCDYDLDEPPGPGVWIFDGTLKITSGKSNHPEDPVEWDTNLHWIGEWRAPNAVELHRWAGRRPKLVGKVGPAPIEPMPERPKPVKTQMRSLDPPSRSRGGFCACGKHVSECCCGEDHSGPHHPSGRAYYDEEWEQFSK